MDQTIGVMAFFPLYFYAYEISEALVSLRGRLTLRMCAGLANVMQPWNPPLTFVLVIFDVAPSFSSASHKLMENLGGVFLMQYRVWPLANFVNFKFVPERLRILTSNVLSVFWNAFLCTRLA